ncbi:MAG: transposase [Opitutaceae bacterium]
MFPVHTTRFQRGKLPHWEVEGGRYFITIRLADSLPRETVLRWQEIHRGLSGIEPQSARFAALQRQYFLAMEKYLDAGAGASVLRDANLAKIVIDELLGLTEWLVEAAHFAIMPNHLHALLVPQPGCNHTLADIMKRLKGRSGHRIREALGGSGPVWQREWFDRWMRDEFEWEQTVRYIQENPVKAGLVARWQDHAWTK